MQYFNDMQCWLQFSVDMALIEGSSPLVHIVLNASLIDIFELL